MLIEPYWTRRRPARSRRGIALYSAVMINSLLVGVLALSALTIVRIERRSSESSREIVAAQLHARAAVDLALQTVRSDPNWRMRYMDGVETKPLSFGEGTVSWKLKDASTPPDGNLGNHEDDPVEIQGIGRAGKAIWVHSAIAVDTGASRELGPIQLKTAGRRTRYNTVKASKWWAQYFKPNLPAEATGWRVTSVDLYLASSNHSTESLQVNLYTPDNHNLPQALVDGVAIPRSDLSSNAGWHMIRFSGNTNLDPTKGLCISLECTTENAAAWFAYDNRSNIDPDSALIRGNQASGWTSYHPRKTLFYRVMGMYTVPSGLTLQFGTFKRAAAP